MPFHGILVLLLLVLVRSAFGAGMHGSHGRSRSPSLEVLEERYAKGEMQRDEYLQKKHDLGG